jgi:hypothetical protein
MIDFSACAAVYYLPAQSFGLRSMTFVVVSIYAGAVLLYVGTAACKNKGFYSASFCRWKLTDTEGSGG